MNDSFSIRERHPPLRGRREVHMRKQSIMERAWLKRGLSASLSVVLAATLAGVAPAAAFASEQDEADRWAEAIEEQLADQSIQTYAYSENAIALADDSGSSTTTLDPTDWYSLLDPNKKNSGILDASGKMYTATSDSVVTPVKLQNPWGTCWGFSIIAACETSILSETGGTAGDLDLSELQLIGSVYKEGGVPESVSSSQAGEGYHNESSNPNAAFNMGGFMNYGATAFASGIGPITEEYVPYQNKGLIGSEDNSPIIECVVTYDEIDDKTKMNKVEQAHLTEEQIEAKKAEPGVKSVVEYYYAGNYTETVGEGESAEAKACYTDWSVSDDYYTTAYYNLENSNILPETRNLTNDGKYESTNLKAVQAIQSELKAGRAVSVAFCADTSMPGQDSSNSKYINTNWAHYTCDNQSLNHAVTIVGYDNDYAASNFATGFADAAAHTPEGDGAWLVKNSWGSESEEFPNKYSWGMKDVNDESSGYFWLSYYDKSVTLFESFDFDVNSYSENSEYYVDQYDYLPEVSSYYVNSIKPTSSANIFTVESQDSDGEGYNSIAIRTLSCATYKPNTEVTYQVYLLDDEATTPTDPAHSSLVYTSDPVEYTYGGYHRTTLAEDEWINVRDGQRYAVVTTQQCKDDGMYYQGVAYNQARPTEEQVDEYEKLVTEQTTAQYREALYPIVYSSLLDSENPKTGEKYTEEEAKEVAPEATETLLKSEFVQALIKSAVDSAVDQYKNTYLTSVVNKGESWTGITTDDGVTEWADWVRVTNAAETEAKTEQNLSIVADNAPVKAFAELTDYASIAELDALKAAIEAAKAALESLKISTDGSDVAADTQWVTQEQYDALKAALATAEAMLADAGNYSDKLSTIAAGTPQSDSVIAATANLAVNSQAGTKAAVVNTNTKTKGNGTYAKTGDAATSAAAAFACVATIAGAAAIAARRRQRD